MAVVLKYFIVEAYKIPSGSMQPTLMGSPETGIFDRILVDKLSYHFRDPKRWEVAVFKYPLDRSKNFVKRIVGVGPEHIAIERGDLWHRSDESEPWKILRRPRKVLLAMMRALDLGPPSDGTASRWKPLGAHTAERWSCDGRRVAARGTGGMRFAHEREGLGSIVDGYTDGYPPRLAADVQWSKPAGMNEVGDLRVDGAIRALPGLEEFAVELVEGGYTYRFTWPGPAAGPDAAAAIEIEGLVDEERDARVVGQPFRLPEGEALRFAAQNVDDLLVLEFDERALLTLEAPATRNQRSSVLAFVAGEGADLDDLQVRRDVYYTNDRVFDAEVVLAEGEYYMLGDNTQDSSDSREWRYLELRWPGAGSEGAVVRGGWRPQENPVTVSTVEGRLTFFDDQWGERHVIEAGTEERVGYVTAPSVPRELIVGRALLVFWPWSFEYGLARLRWIL